MKVRVFQWPWGVALAAAARRLARSESKGALALSSCVHLIVVAISPRTRGARRAGCRVERAVEPACLYRRPVETSVELSSIRREHLN
jgi:hypothetical protein